MSSELRRVWTDVIVGQDYDQHMAAVGQAQANAELLHDLVKSLRLYADTSILYVGAGTGQMFDYIAPHYFGDFKNLFTDINPNFLYQLEARLENQNISFTTAVDDIEATKLEGPFNVITVVLVLEHVDWKKALAQMAGLNPWRIVLITQENPPSITTGVTPGRKLPPSLEEATKIAHSGTIDATELTDELAKLGFELLRQENREVPDEKIMRGMIFKKS